MAMEFWGVEVKAGEPLKVEAEAGILLHLSQASLGEVKKDKAESVVVYVNIDGKKLVIGTLSSDKCPQISYDLVFEKEFELSHTGKGSVHFLGYKAEMDEQSEDDDFDMNTSSGSEEESEDEDVPLPIPIPSNGKPEPEAEKSKVVEKVKAAKPETSKGKEVKPEDDSEETTSDEDDDDDSREDDSDDEDMVNGGSSDDEDDDDEESSEEEAEPTPENAKKNKKRAAESAAKTPAAEKKAKLVTPQKSGGDGKKGNAHTATPHPSKGGKANAKQSPKSASQVSCKACSKTFNSDGALQSHTKAKHSESK